MTTQGTRFRASPMAASLSLAAAIGATNLQFKRVEQMWPTITVLPTGTEGAILRYNGTAAAWQASTQALSVPSAGDHITVNPLWTSGATRYQALQFTITDSGSNSGPDSDVIALYRNGVLRFNVDKWGSMLVGPGGVTAWVRIEGFKDSGDGTGSPYHRAGIGLELFEQFTGSVGSVVTSFDASGATGYSRLTLNGGSFGFANQTLGHLNFSVDGQSAWAIYRTAGTPDLYSLYPTSASQGDLGGLAGLTTPQPFRDFYSARHGVFKSSVNNFRQLVFSTFVVNGASAEPIISIGSTPFQAYSNFGIADPEFNTTGAPAVIDCTLRHTASALTASFLRYQKTLTGANSYTLPRFWVSVEGAVTAGNTGGAASFTASHGKDNTVAGAPNFNIGFHFVSTYKTATTIDVYGFRSFGTVDGSQGGAAIGIWKDFEANGINFINQGGSPATAGTIVGYYCQSITGGSANYAIYTNAGDIRFGDRVVFGPAAGKILGGATNLSIRNAADNADNLLIADAGDVTVRRSLLVNNPTYTTDIKALDVAATWNASGVTFTGARFNFTSTASAAASLLADFQLGGTSVLKLRKDGLLTHTPTGVVGFVMAALASSVFANAALATTATDGFIYVPTCAGAPTGTPTAQTGTVALVYDTTNNKLYVYNTAWKSVALT
jgi:hypothetical protein